MDTTQTQPDLDALIWGAENIGIAAKVITADPNDHKQKAKYESQLKSAYYKLAKKIIPAKKAGAIYISTLRKIRSIVDD
jgi:hypothetical protein